MYVLTLTYLICHYFNFADNNYYYYCVHARTCVCTCCTYSYLQLPYKLDECDDEGDIPLNLALLNRHESMASTLVSNKCNLNILNRDGDGLLHLAILRGDGFAASFLVKNGGSTTLARK